jgi:hypothetical protein
LYASVEGFLEVPVLGRLLEPPLRQQVDVAQAVGGGGPVAGDEARTD